MDFDQVAVNGVNSNNMSAYADHNHAPSLTDVRLENIIQQDNKQKSMAAG